MTAASRSIADKSRASFFASAPKVRRVVGVPVGVFAIALLIGACDRTAPSEAEQSASAQQSHTIAPMEVAFDRLALDQGDVAGVTAVVTDWDAAWNAGDATALLARFVDDAEFINGRGQLAIGKATIRANHKVSLAGVFKGSHTHGTIRRITFLNGTSAVVDVDNDVTNFSALPPGTLPTRPGVQSGRHKRLVVKSGGTWRVVLMQLTSIAPAPAPVPPPAM